MKIEGIPKTARRYRFEQRHVDAWIRLQGADYTYGDYGGRKQFEKV